MVKRVIFSSNNADPKGRDFDLYTINVDGTGVERNHFQQYLRRVSNVFT